MSTELTIKDMIKGMTKFIQNNDEEEGSPKPLNPAQVWPLLFDICLHEPDTWEHLCPIISHYIEDEDQFRKQKVPFVEEKVNAFLTGDAKYQFTNLAPIVYLLPFFPNNFVIPILTHLIQLFQQCLSSFNETKFFPKQLLHSFELCLADLFEAETHTTVSNFFITSTADASTSVATACVFAPIITGLLAAASEDDLLPRLSEACFSLVKTLVAGDVLHQISGLFFLEYLVEFWASYVCDHQFNRDEETELHSCMLLEKDLYEFLAPFLLNSDPIVRKYALHAAENAALSPYVLKTKEVVQILFQEFPKYDTPEKLSVFFKLLSSLVDTEVDEDSSDDEDDNKPGLEFLEPVLDFITKLLQDESSNPIAKANCFDTLLTIAESADNPDIIEDLIQPSLTVIQSFISQRLYQTYPCFVSFLSYASKEFGNGEEADVALTQFLQTQTPTLVYSLSELQKQPEIKFNDTLIFARNIGKLVKDGYGKTCIDSLFTFAQQYLSVPDKKSDPNDINGILIEEKRYNSSMKVICGSSYMIKSLSNSLSAEQASTIFNLISERLNDVKIEDIETIEILLKSLAKILLFNKVPQSDLIANQLINGTFNVLAAAHKDLLHFQQFSSAYDYLESYLKQFPEKSNSIIETFLGWYTDVDDVLDSEGTIGTLEILAQISRSGTIKEEELATKIANSLKPILQKVTLNDLDILAGVLRILQPIRETFHGALQPLNDFITPLAEFADQKAALDEEENQEENEEDLADTLDIVMPDVALFTLSAYVDDPDLAVNFKFINTIIGMMPFSPNEEGDDQNYMLDLLAIILNMMKQDERFGDAMLEICKLITEMLMMKKSEIEVFNLPDDLLKDMKCELKKALNKNPALERKVAKLYSKQRSSLNRYKALLR